MAVPSASDPFSGTWAIVPLRGLESAKTRLAPDLDAEERLELVTAMASRTLAACRDAASLAGTVLVTRDPVAARLAEAFDARTLVQRLPGLNPAIREARAVAIHAGATAVLILPIDLPLVSAAAIDEVVAATRSTFAAAGEETGVRRGIVAAVPDRHGTGTNVLLVAPPGAVDPAFGEDSRRLHREAARAADVTWLQLDGPLTFDVDTVADLAAAVAAEAGSAAAAGRPPGA